jgi:hypothetical protein
MSAPLPPRAGRRAGDLSSYGNLPTGDVDVLMDHGDRLAVAGPLPGQGRDAALKCIGKARLGVDQTGQFHRGTRLEDVSIQVVDLAVDAIGETHVQTMRDRQLMRQTPLNRIPGLDRLGHVHGEFQGLRRVRELHPLGAGDRRRLIRVAHGVSQTRYASIAGHGD